jgi:hypothetical protein
MRAFAFLILLLVSLVTTASGNLWIFVPSGVIAFSPSDVSGLQLWLDATDMNGNGDGNSGWSDTDVVTTWDDKSSNDYDATGSGSNKPTFETSEQNGNPCVKFDDASARQYLTVTDQDSLSVTNGMSAFVVLKVVTNAEQKFIMGKSTAASPEWQIAIWEAGFNDINLGIFGDSTAAPNSTWHGRRTTNDVTSGNTYLINAEFPGGASSDPDDLDIYLNGTVSDASTDNTGSGFPADNGSSNLEIGARSWTSFEWSMDGDLICEIVFYNAQLSSGDRGSVKTYLCDKWGLTCS